MSLDISGTMTFAFKRLRLRLVPWIAMLVQFGSRMMFWGGGSRDRDDDDNGGGANAIFMVIGLIAMILGPFMSTILQWPCHETVST